VERLLLSPLRLGSVELRNRVVSTAHGAFLDFYRPGEPGDRYIAYQERRARGGCGLIVLQPVHVHRSSQAAGHYVYDPGDLRPKLRRIAGALHSHGARVLIQLMHFGGEFRSDARVGLEPLWGFSPALSPTGAEAVHAMTEAEIEEVIDGFAATAALALECGLDGVELHAAHGYLLHQSFSPWANRRTDAWGGRHRFLDAVVERVRAAVGDEAVVGIRMSADDFIPPERGGLGPEGLREVAAHLAAGGRLDYLSQSGGSRAAHYARAIGSYRHRPGEWLELAAAMKRAVGEALPVIAAGRITTPALAERALREHACDLVAMTRAQIADPDLVRKLERGEAGRIRPCVGANQGCVDRMVGGLPITCFHNPEVGRERDRAGDTSPGAGRVLVVGGGPAGLKAAETAARRGMRVTLVDRRKSLGGRLRLVGRCGAARELLGSVAWLEPELARLGVELRLGTEADAALLEAERPDAVVLATGATPDPDAIDGGDGSIPILSIDEAVTADPAGDRVLVVDLAGSDDVALTAERLAEAGSQVTVATPLPVAGQHIGFTRSVEQNRRLYELGCTLEPSTVLAGIEARQAATMHVHSRAQRRRPFDRVVAGAPGVPELALLEAVERVGATPLVAGDAVAPRTALHAFREGADAGAAV
jgi:2,4-dienoyl-CoA reductase-like NADH-dependent reductase (Old Yellow Enzyme family)